MIQNQVLIFAVAIYIGTTLKNFFDAFMRDLVLPLLSPVATTEAGISKLVVQIGGIKLNVGDLIVQTLNLVVVFMVVSFLLPYLKEYVPVAGRRA
jgi:large-conductance mechanosensitive channel